MKARVIGLKLDVEGNEIVELRFDDAELGLYQTLMFRADKLVSVGTVLTLGLKFEYDLVLCLKVEVAA